MPRPVAIPSSRVMPVGYLEIQVRASWQEAGAERGRRRQSVIKSQVHGQEQNVSGKYTNISHDSYQVFGVCTLAVQWESMRKV